MSLKIMKPFGIPNSCTDWDRMWFKESNIVKICYEYFHDIYFFVKYPSYTLINGTTVPLIPGLPAFDAIKLNRPV